MADKRRLSCSAAAFHTGFGCFLLKDHRRTKSAFCGRRRSCLSPVLGWKNGGEVNRLVCELWVICTQISNINARIWSFNAIVQEKVQGYVMVSAQVLLCLLKSINVDLNDHRKHLFEIELFCTLKKCVVYDSVSSSKLFWNTKTEIVFSCKKKSLFKPFFQGNNVNVFTVTFDQFNASLLNNSINLLKKQSFYAVRLK